MSPETPEQDLSHPSWCAQLRCTYYAHHGVGRHVSTPRKFKLALEPGMLTVFISEERLEEDGPLLTFETRGCACSTCEPTSSFHVPLAAGRRFIAVFGSWGEAVKA